MGEEEESKLVKALKVFKEKICQKYDIKEMILFEGFSLPAGVKRIFYCI